METRGRVSELEREVSAIPTLQVVPVEALAPSVLSADEATEWQTVCGNMPRGWYRREYQGVLISYCRQVVRSNYFSSLAAAIPTSIRSTEEGMAEYIKLTKAAERADRAADKFATTLRITPQSRYDAQKASRDSNKAQSQRPW